MRTSTASSIRLVTAIPGPRSVELQKQREESVPRGVGSVLPVFIQRAEGCTIEDIDGNQFLDFTGGIGCQNAGHCPPGAVAAVQMQASQFFHTCFMVTPYEGYVRLAQELNRRTPGAFAKKTFFVNSGAEAVENAVKIARHFTRRAGIVAFEDSFHGRTQLAMSLTGKTKPYKAGFGPFAPEIYRMPYPNPYRPAYGPSGYAEALESTFRRQIEAESVAAVIFEPVLGEGGFVVPPRDWFPVLAKICREHGILLIADEIQTGFGRTGTLFACEQLGIEPDLIVSAKSIAAGLPIAAVTGRAEIMDSPGPGGLGGTYGGNPLACAAALEVLKEVDAGLAAGARHIGQVFESVTQRWMDRFPLIGDIRGMGAMRALELVRDRATKEPADRETKQLLAACHQRGLLIISAGALGNVVRLLVPLIATDEQLHEGLSILEEALAGMHTA